MNHACSNGSRILLGLFACWLLLQASGAGADWTQWGGPHRNFTTDSTGLARNWPAEGPRRLWDRVLGEGYSGIAVDGLTLYTMYRDVARLWQVGRSDQEVVVALDASTGRTLWEHRYDAAARRGLALEHGPGPHVTPLVVGPHLYTVGILGHLLCLEKSTGRVVWKHDLVEAFGAPLQNRGYASSPVAYRDTIILPVGGSGQAWMAFRQSDGAVVWKNQSMSLSPSSPVLIQVGGQEQLVAFMAAEIAGLDPASGELLWRYPHRAQFGLNISTPIWTEGNLLFCSSAYGGGSRLLRLTRSDGPTHVEHLWHTNRARIHIGNALRIGDLILGSSGDFGPSFLTALDVHTGENLWQDRTFAKASFLYADGKVILLDEDGVLALLTVSREGPEILARAQVLESNAWTTPSLVGTRLYLRDRKQILALDLGE